MLHTYQLAAENQQTGCHLAAGVLMCTAVDSGSKDTVLQFQTA
jgi:hypothetical protein